MNKKIKDLTIEECYKICNNNECKKCPLSYGENRCYIIYLYHIQDIKKLNKNKEVEIDESNND